MTSRHVQSESALALRFFFLCVAVFGGAGVLAAVLIRAGVRPGVSSRLELPPAFWITSMLLLAGSAALHQALRHVRLERQKPFRQWLLAALAGGTLFVGVQIYGLWCLVQIQDPTRAQTGVDAFVLVFAACHGLHFVVALLFVAFVTVNAWAGRYDHEYYWGVLVCTYFWHVLGIAWVFILGIFAVVA